MTTTTSPMAAQIETPPAEFDPTHLKENLRWGHLFWPGSTPLTEEQIDDRVDRYQKSLQRYRASGMRGNYLPDDLEVDSAWHAHQCDPVGYAEFCTRYFGGILAHTATLCVCKLVEDQPYMPDPVTVDTRKRP